MKETEWKKFETDYRGTSKLSATFDNFGPSALKWMDEK